MGPELVVIVREHLGIDDGVITLAVVVAAEPNSDVPRIGHLIEIELVARDLRHVDRHLGASARGGEQGD